MNTQNSGEELHLKDIILIARDWISFLKKKILLIGLIALAGTALGFLYASQQKPVYTATLSFALEDDKGGGGGGLSGALGIASSFGLDLGGGAGGAFNSANLTELMKSRNIIEKTLLNAVQLNGKKITLAEQYINFNGWREKWDKNPSSASITYPADADRTKFTLQQDSILGIIYNNLVKENVSINQKDKKISILTVEVKSRNELFSKYFAESLVKEVSDFYIETKSKKSKLNVEILEKQADSIRAELNGAITGVAIANDQIYNLNSALNVQRTSTSKRQIDVQTNSAILVELVKNLELAKMSLRKETPLIQIIDVPRLPLEKIRMSKLITGLSAGLACAFLTVLGLIVSRIFRLNFK